MENAIDILKEWIDKSDNIVFFGGAGVSTESGIKDFRSEGNYLRKGNLTLEQLISATYFREHTKDFYDMYRSLFDNTGIMPNITHKRLAELEKEGKLKAIVTQNVDGLHQLAGSKNVLTLHGDVSRNYCLDCHKLYDEKFVFSSKGIPRCECGGIVKPDVVLYEEGLDQEILEKSINAIANADVLIVAGTSLSVYPAAGLVNYYKGNKLVLINKTSTPYDSKADLLLHEPLGEIFSKI
ncbi:MAG: NAD-dependent protein deacylase [bacterium]|nr:NAD-dependent protein deacylase [bacterium]